MPLGLSQSKPADSEGTSLTSTAAQEQAWNRAQLAQPVRAPRWRLWAYEAPALVLGCSQRALHERLSAASPALPMDVLLRESGGGAVLAGPWLIGLSLALPVGHSWLRRGLPDSYRHLGELHAQALAELGVAAHALPPARLAGTQADLVARGLPAPDWACFGSLSPWEVVDVRGRKLVGLAQRRCRSGALLVAGTLVAEPDWGLLCEAIGRPQEEAVLRGRTVSCAELVGQSFSRDAWAGALTASLRRQFG